MRPKWQPRIGSRSLTLPAVRFCNCGALGAGAGGCPPGPGQRGGLGEDSDHRGERNERGDDPIWCECTTLGEGEYREQVCRRR